MNFVDLNVIWQKQLQLLNPVCVHLSVYLMGLLTIIQGIISPQNRRATRLEVWYIIAWDITIDWQEFGKGNSAVYRLEACIFEDNSNGRRQIMGGQ